MSKIVKAYYNDEKKDCCCDSDGTNQPSIPNNINLSSLEKKIDDGVNNIISSIRKTPPTSSINLDGVEAIIDNSVSNGTNAILDKIPTLASISEKIIESEARVNSAIESTNNNSSDGIKTKISTAKSDIVDTINNKYDGIISSIESKASDNKDSIIGAINNKSIPSITDIGNKIKESEDRIISTITAPNNVTLEQITAEVNKSVTASETKVLSAIVAESAIEKLLESSESSITEAIGESISESLSELPNSLPNIDGITKAINDSNKNSSREIINAITSTNKRMYCKTRPNKVEYREGDVFDKTGMVVCIKSGTGYESNISESIILTPGNGNVLTRYDKEISIVYNESIRSYECKCPIYVHHVVKIEMHKFSYGIIFSNSDEVITDDIELKVYYSDGSTEIINSGFTNDFVSGTTISKDTDMHITYRGFNFTYTIRLIENPSYEDPLVIIDNPFYDPKIPRMKDKITIADRNKISELIGNMNYTYDNNTRSKLINYHNNGSISLSNIWKVGDVFESNNNKCVVADTNTFINGQYVSIVLIPLNLLGVKLRSSIKVKPKIHNYPENSINNGAYSTIISKGVIDSDYPKVNNIYLNDTHGYSLVYSFDRKLGQDITKNIDACECIINKVGTSIDLSSDNDDRIFVLTKDMIFGPNRLRLFREYTLAQINSIYGLNLIGASIFDIKFSNPVGIYDYQVTYNGGGTANNLKMHFASIKPDGVSLNHNIDATALINRSIINPRANSYLANSITSFVLNNAACYGIIH